MTKRIRDIALRATIWCEENAQGTPVAWEWEEQFAKFLIEECMGKMSMEFIDHGMIDVAITNTSEYFGIEE